MIQPAGQNRIMYIDPWTGISGDMLLGSLLDLDRTGSRLEARLRETVHSLGLGGTALEVVRDMERGIACTRVRVHADGVQPLRRLSDMEDLVDRAAVTPEVRRRAVAALRRLATTEADVHGCGLDDIHFHEVGAVDTLVDVVGTLALIEELDVRNVLVGPIPVGGGSAEIAHGRIGLPAPATVLLLEGYPVVGGPEMRELTTPTGALLIKELGARPGPLPPMSIEGVGYGAGTMKLECGPNVLRTIIGRSWEGERVGADTDPGATDTVILLESNLDDISAEVLGHTTRLLREAGALDVWSVAAAMKKDRPGAVLHVLISPQDEPACLDIVFMQTGTLGVRRQILSRWLASRGVVRVHVAGGEVGVKWGRWRGRLVSVAAEYEEAAQLAASTGIALKDIMQEAAAKASELLTPDGLLP